MKVGDSKKEPFMKIEDLKEDSLIKLWLNQINSERSIKDYLMSMHVFVEWVKKTPTELILEADDEVKNGVHIRERKITSYLVDFKLELQKKGLAPLTQKSYLSGVRSFYKYNYVETHSANRLKAKPLKKNKYTITKEELREILKVTDPLETAVVLIGCSSGLSANEIINLKIEDLNFDEETGITTLELTRQKTDFSFITFTTKEATEAIKTYIAYRGRKTKTTELKRIRQLDNQKITDDSNYLFIKKLIPKLYTETYDDELRKLTTNGLMKMYRGIAEKAKKSTKKGEWNKIRTHAMRKFFFDTLDGAECGQQHIEEFMGHKLPGVQEHYSSKSVKKLKAIYIKYADSLTIQEIPDIKQNPEYIKAIQQSDNFAQLAIKATVERAEIQEIRQELNRIKIYNEKLADLKDIGKLVITLREHESELSNDDKAHYYKLLDVHNLQLKNNPLYREYFKDIEAGTFKKYKV